MCVEEVVLVCVAVVVGCEVVVVVVCVVVVACPVVVAPCEAVVGPELFDAPAPPAWRRAWLELQL